jgi:soluble P-type ATPase
MTAVQLRTCLARGMRVTGQGFSPQGAIKRNDEPLAGLDRVATLYALLPAVLCSDASIVHAPKAKTAAAQLPAPRKTVAAPAVTTSATAAAPAAAVIAAGAVAQPQQPQELQSVTVVDAAGAGSAVDAVAVGAGAPPLPRSPGPTPRARTPAGAAAAAADAIAAGDAASLDDALACFAALGGGNFVATSETADALWTLTGDPTEGALLVAAMKAGWASPGTLRAACPRLSNLPFTAESKWMATLHDVPLPPGLLPPAVDDDGRFDGTTATPESAAAVAAAIVSGAHDEAASVSSAVPPPADARTSFAAARRPSVVLPADLLLPPRRLLLVKGAPDRVIPRCAYQAGPVAGGSAGNAASPHAVVVSPFAPVPIDAPRWQAVADTLAGEGLRVLALAMAEVPAETAAVVADDIAKGEPRLTLTALVGIVDPPRQECVGAIRECKTAGVRVAMITGDSPLTAKAVGGWLGLDVGTVLTGTDMSGMTDDQLADAVGTCCIYARATPEHKLRIVRALQTHHKATCAMTGDGVNDAPALKAANVGVAMGITGTEVAKEASKMILADDNFATIVAAIKQGASSPRVVRVWWWPLRASEFLRLLRNTVYTCPPTFCYCRPHRLR